MAEPTLRPGETDAPAAPTISAIMPVYNAADYLRRSLPPLLAMLHTREIHELLVVDDGSTDTTARLAADLGAEVIPSGGQLGPAAARNCAAARATGTIFWFVDADIAVDRNAPQQLAAGFTDPGVVAVFGAYDDHPPAQNFLSQYKNLVHHYYHNRAPREASTFWSGIGAVRSSAFAAVGGFNAAMRCVEDIELGYRLRDAGGRILLLPQLQGTHLKAWHLLQLLRTEICCRALPWSRLLLTRTGARDDLNVALDERVRAGIAGLALILLGAAAANLLSWWTVPVAGLALAAANRPLFGFFRRRKGALFALRAVLFHQLYYLYSSAAFVWSWIEVRLLQRHRAPSAG
ncbi:MAG: glycosyltransferase [Pseudomonadota bacterium]